MPWTSSSSYTSPSNTNIQKKNDFNGTAVSVDQIFNFVSDQTNVVNAKLSALKAAGSSISISDMFEMQMKMNRLSQFSEMATSVVSAAGTAISSIARNVK